MIFWGLNMAIIVDALKCADMGGSIAVHTFGAYFGIGASWWFQPTRASLSPNNTPNHNSEIIAMVGSIFLWIFWPSFNAALAGSPDSQHRAITNTFLSIGSGAMGAALLSRIFHGKLEMTIVMNATLAGGVAVGAACDIITHPAAAMWVGLFAGTWSALGF
jgi:ammonium transporter Rh